MKERPFRPNRRAATHNINYDERVEAPLDHEGESDSDGGTADADYLECDSEHQAVNPTGPPSLHTRR